MFKEFEKLKKAKHQYSNSFSTQKASEGSIENKIIDFASYTVSGDSSSVVWNITKKPKKMIQQQKLFVLNKHMYN